jgi:Mor family transcriptional regulator
LTVNTRKFIEKLVEVVEKELELVQNGIVRAPDKKRVSFPPEHRIIEELLILLGYGGKEVYVRSPRSEIRETIEQVIYSDYQRGLNIHQRGYGGLLKKKLQKMGVEVNDRTLKSVLKRVRQRCRKGE